jgi:hypothetical protein
MLKPLRTILERAVSVVDLVAAGSSAVTIALTGFALGTCLLYGLLLGIPGRGQLSTVVFVVVAGAVMYVTLRATHKAESEEGLQELKRNPLFALMLGSATVARDCLAAIVLFRLVLEAFDLVGQKNVAPGWPALGRMVREVIFR